MIPGLLESLASLQIISSEVINETIEKFQWHSNPQEPSSILTGSVRVALDSAFSHSSVKSIMRALETLTLSKENKVKTWATHTLDGLHMRSPTALVIGLQCYRNSRDGDLAKAFQVETGIAAALCVSWFPTHWIYTAERIFREGLAKTVSLVSRQSCWTKRWADLLGYL